MWGRRFCGEIAVGRVPWLMVGRGVSSMLFERMTCLLCILTCRGAFPCHSNAFLCGPVRCESSALNLVAGFPRLVVYQL